MILHPVGPLPSCFVTICFHLFVALCVDFHAPFVLKDDMDIVIGVLQEEEGEGSVDLTLSLAGRNNPKL